MEVAGDRHVDRDPGVEALVHLGRRLDGGDLQAGLAGPLLEELEELVDLLLLRQLREGLLEALLEQAKKVTLTSRAFRNDQLPLLYKELSEMTGYEMSLPMNSGEVGS